MIRTKRWMRRVLLLLASTGLALVLGAAYLWQDIKRRDVEHARFLDCGQSINLFLKHYAEELVEAHRRGDAETVLSSYADDYHSSRRGHWRLTEDQDLGAAARCLLRAEGRDDFDRRALASELAAYLRGITSVQSIKCKIDLIEHAIPDKSALITVKYILDGEDRAGRLIEDRFFFRWRLTKVPRQSGLSEWRITSDELVEGERVAGRGKEFFKPNPSSIGVDYVHRRDPKLDPTRAKIKFAVIQYASGGVSAVDYDDDGRPDLFFSDGVRSRLFKNLTVDSDAISFRDVTTGAGLDGIDQAHCALFCDVDRDGDRDLFVVRYLAPARLYRNRGDGTFEDATSGSGLDFVTPATAATFFDYDADGLPDLYVGNNGNAFQASPRIPFYATNGEPNRLYRNIDGHRFVDVTQESGTGDTGWALAVCASDFDGDGKVDLGVANDFGRKVLYRNNGNGTFTDVAKKAGVLDFSGGMGLAFGDLNFDGRPDLYTSNINSNQRWFGEEITLWQYGRNLVRSGWLLTDFAEVLPSSTTWSAPIGRNLARKSARVTRSSSTTATAPSASSMKVERTGPVGRGALHCLIWTTIQTWIFTSPMGGSVMPIKMTYDCHLLMVRSHISISIDKVSFLVPSLSERTLGTATRTSFCSSAWGMGHSPTSRVRWGATRSRTGAEWRSPT